MVTGELDEVGMYLTLHAPLMSLQVSSLNLPEPLVDHVTLPVGAEEPMTTALHVVGFPTTTGIGVQVTVTELTVIASMLLLGRLLVSPLYVALRMTGPTAIPVTLTWHW
jgi:hypothetical protein